VLFNGGCNKQVFYPNPIKKFGADPSCRFREKHKNDALQFRKMTSPSQKLGYSNNQLKAVNRLG